MSKLNFGDIVALAKAGYKYAEVKELLALDLPETNEAPAPAQPEKVNPEPTPEPTPAPAQPEKVNPEPTPEPTPAPSDTETPAKATGQPVESEEDKARIAELEKQIKDLQSTNQSKDVSGNVQDPQTDIDDFVRSFM